MNRRDFLRYTTAGTASLWIGSKLPRWLTNDRPYAATDVLSLTFTDAIKEMVTNNVGQTDATCYFWILKASAAAMDLPAESPGPTIFAFEGDTIALTLTNALSQPHRLAVPSLDKGFPTSGPFTSPTLAPGAANVSFSFTLPAGSAGTYLYYDDLNPPVNRVMGLHGALVVMPAAAKAPPPMPTAPKITPYTNPPPRIQRLFDDLGTAPWFPGLAWEQGGANPICSCGADVPSTPPFRQYIWLLHEASPNLFKMVGDFAGDFSVATFLDLFFNNHIIGGSSVSGPPSGRRGGKGPSASAREYLDDILGLARGPGRGGSGGGPINTPPTDIGFVPEYFTVNGQSGHFSSSNPFQTPHLRVGEPCVVRVLNAGLWSHCMHIHANHVYALRYNPRGEFPPGGPFNAAPEITNPAVVPALVDNLFWVDTWGTHPLDVWDWLVPFIRPPDVPNNKGIGRADLSEPLPVGRKPVPRYGTRKKGNRKVRAATPTGSTTWPPTQELNMAIPPAGTKVGGIPIQVQLSPLCYPMHDHSEPSQAAQGGNYNSGLITGLDFVGDRNTPDPVTGAPVTTFPNAPKTFGPDLNVSVHPAAGPPPPFDEV